MVILEDKGADLRFRRHGLTAGVEGRRNIHQRPPETTGRPENH